MYFTKKVHMGQRWLTLHTRGVSAKWGKGSEEGRGDRICPYMEYLWRIWHKQGLSSQTTCTIILDKTKYVMKNYTIFTLCLLTKSKPDNWYFFQPKLKLTKWLILWWQVVGRAGTVLETCYSDHLLSHWDRQDLDRTVCAAPGLLLRPSKYQCGPGIYSNGMEVRLFSFTTQ